MTHLRLPLVGEVLDDGATVAYDITGEPVFGAGWRPDVGGEEPNERGPPDEWDCVDPPSREE